MKKNKIYDCTFTCYPARGRGPNAPPGNNLQTNMRQAFCVYCQETGHFSNDCPSHISSGSRNARRHGNDTCSCISLYYSVLTIPIPKHNNLGGSLGFFLSFFFIFPFLCCHWDMHWWYALVWRC